jgi:uncharacterized lipoprotein YmbA
MKARIAACLAAAALAAGCFGGPSPKLNYYTLSSPIVPPAPASPPSLAVYVGPVSVPDAVDRPQMVLRSDANQVDLAELHRWAEPLKLAIPRAIADSLMRELGTQRVMTSRQSATLDFDYRVALDVQRFDSSYTGGAVIEVLWTLRNAKTGTTRIGRSVVREAAPSPDASGVAAAHSRALEQVGREIAAAIKASPGT